MAWSTDVSLCQTLRKVDELQRGEDLSQSFKCKELYRIYILQQFIQVFPLLPAIFQFHLKRFMYYYLVVQWTMIKVLTS